MEKSYFISHGSPMTIIESQDNYYKNLSSLDLNLNAKGILVISAHWLSSKSSLTSSENPEIIYDFYGFPNELYEVKPNLRGDSILGQEIANKLELDFDNSRGFDHGTWGPLEILNINTKLPIFQLSLNYNLSLEEHFNLAKKLRSLREEGYIIISSGGLVHNLGLLSFKKEEVFNWAQEIELSFIYFIKKKEYNTFLDPSKFKNYNLAIPELSHYLPFIYFLGSILDSEDLDIFNSGINYGNISMLCLKTN